MKSKPRHRSHLDRNPAYRQAFERLDEALEEGADGSYAERLDLVGHHMFGELWHEPKESSSPANAE